MYLQCPICGVVTFIVNDNSNELSFSLEADGKTVTVDRKSVV